MSTNIRFPLGPLVDSTGMVTLEWSEWLQNPQVLTIDLGEPLGVLSGGTGLTGGTSGGVLAFTASDTITSSGLLGASKLVLGGGAGSVPSTPVGLGSTTTLLHGNAAGAPTWAAVSLSADVSGVLPVANGGTGLSTGTSGGLLAFTTTGTISSSALLTNHAIVLGGGVGAVPATPLGLGTTTTILHGNAAGAPTWAAVSLSADVTGNLPVTNLNSGTAASNVTFWRGDGTWVAPSAGSLTGVVPIANGGTNSGTALSGSSIMVSDGAEIIQGAAGTTTTVLHGNAGGVPTYAKVSLTADVSGTLPVGNGGTGNTALAALTKTDDTNVTLTLGGSPTTALVNAASLTLGWTGTLTVARGGTGLGTLTAHAIYVGNGTSAPTALSVGANNTYLKGATGADPAFATITLASADFANQGTTTTVLHGNAAGNPSFAAVSLTNDVTGTLGLAKGGTNADLSATGGTNQVLKQASSGAAITVGTLATTNLSDVTGKTTFTPNDASGAGLAFSIADGDYDKAGSKVTVQLIVSYPATADASNAAVGNLPATVSNNFKNRAGCVASSDLTTMQSARWIENTATLGFFKNDGTRLTNANLSSKTVYIGGSYFV